MRRSRHCTVGAAADGAEIGPLISGRAVESVDALVRQAIAAGARISHRAPVPDSKGWFYPPTVLADVPADADILDAEIFGPVAPIVAWHDDDRAAQARQRLRDGACRLRIRR